MPGFARLCLVLVILWPIVGAATDEVYVGYSGNDSLEVYDLDWGGWVTAPMSLLPEGDYPYDVTMHPDGSEVWICGAVGDGIVVVDTSTYGVITTIDLGAAGGYPVNIAFDAMGSTAYVSARDGNAVVLVDVATHSLSGATIPIPAGPGKGRVRPSDGTIFVVDWYDDFIHAIDPVTLAVTSADIGSSLWDLVIHPSGSPLYAIDRGTDQVHVVDPDTLTVTTSVPVGDDPWGIDITPDGSKLFIANEDSSDVTVINTSDNSVAMTIALDPDADPRDVDITADGQHACVPTGSLSDLDGLYVIDVVSPGGGTIFTAAGTNSNALAVAPEPLGGMIFHDGFESGDTTGWTSATL